MDCPCRDNNCVCCLLWCDFCRGKVDIHSMGPKKRRADGASSSRSAHTDIPHAPPTRVVEATPVDFGFTLRTGTHAQNFNRLKERPWKATRFIDWGLMEQLGLTGELLKMAAPLQFQMFMNLQEPTYKGLTLEFLSTLKTQILEGPEAQEGMCTFYLGGWRRGMTLNDINSVFGFP